jgi:hypothetical protein
MKDRDLEIALGVVKWFSARTASAQLDPDIPTVGQIEEVIRGVDRELGRKKKEAPTGEAIVTRVLESLEFTQHYAKSQGQELLWELSPRNISETGFDLVILFPSGAGGRVGIFTVTGEPAGEKP